MRSEAGRPRQLGLAAEEAPGPGIGWRFGAGDMRRRRPWALGGLAGYASHAAMHRGGRAAGRPRRHAAPAGNIPPDRLPPWPPIAAQSPALSRLLDLTPSGWQGGAFGPVGAETCWRCPADGARARRAGLAFQCLRGLGGARCRAVMAPKTPAAAGRRLLCTALALLWPGDAGYADHTLVDQAGHAARQRTPAAANFVNAVLRRFSARARSPGRLRPPADSRWRLEPPGLVDRTRAPIGRRWAALLAAGQPSSADDAARVNARRSTATDYVHRRANRAAPLRRPAGRDPAVVLRQPCPVQQLPGFCRRRCVGAGRRRPARRAAASLEGLPPGPACSMPAPRPARQAHLLELPTWTDGGLTLDNDPPAPDVARSGGPSTLRAAGKPAPPTCAPATPAADPARPAWWDGRPSTPSC